MSRLECKNFCNTYHGTKIGNLVCLNELFIDRGIFWTAIIISRYRYFKMKTITLLLLISFLTTTAQQRALGTHPDLENKIGKHFPIEDYKNEKGRNFTADDLKGKNTLINFWSTTCEPCLEELPYLNTLQETLGDKANFIAITYDNKEKVTGFVEKRQFNFLHITDSGSQLKSYFPVVRNPMTFILDKNGTVKEITGVIDKTKADAILKLLNE